MLTMTYKRKGAFEDYLSWRPSQGDDWKRHRAWAGTFTLSTDLSYFYLDFSH